MEKFSLFTNCNIDDIINTLRGKNNETITDDIISDIREQIEPIIKYTNKYHKLLKSTREVYSHMNNLIKERDEITHVMMHEKINREQIILFQRMFAMRIAEEEKKYKQALQELSAQKEFIKNTLQVTTCI